MGVMVDDGLDIVGVALAGSRVAVTDPGGVTVGGSVGVEGVQAALIVMTINPTISRRDRVIMQLLGLWLTLNGWRLFYNGFILSHMDSGGRAVYPLVTVLVLISLI